MLDETAQEKEAPASQRLNKWYQRVSKTFEEIEDKARNYARDGKTPLSLAEITTWIAIKSVTEKR